MIRSCVRFCLGLFFGTVLTVCGMAAEPPAASAHGNIWMDLNADENERVTAFHRILLFPLSDTSSLDGHADRYRLWNDELAKRLDRRIKNTDFIRFANPNDDGTSDRKKGKNQITKEDPRYSLLQHFPDEEARAEAVYESDGADGYLLPHLGRCYERTEVSPATWTTVEMESYYEIENGPHGDSGARHYRSWYVNHLIPASEQKQQVMDLDFTVYNARTHQKALTLVDHYRCYGVDESHAFEQAVKNFAGDWSRLKKQKERDIPQGAPTLSLRDLVLPEKASKDDFAVKTVDYAYRDEARDTLKRVKVLAGTDNGRYSVTGTIYSYDCDERWIEPSASTSPSLQWTDTFTWRDRDGKEHTGERRYYRSEITDHYGYHQPYYHVRATLRLVDNLTGEAVFSQTYEREDTERYANALRDMFGDFFREVDHRIGI